MAALFTAALLTICPAGPRDNCVVDGDTWWQGGEKFRLADIDAPEISEPKCAAERELGERAKRRLLELLNGGTPLIERQGADRYGRTLAIVTVRGRSVGAQMVDEGLARRWDGARRSWCG